MTAITEKVTITAPHDPTMVPMGTGFKECVVELHDGTLLEGRVTARVCSTAGNIGTMHTLTFCARVVHNWQRREHPNSRYAQMSLEAFEDEVCDAWSRPAFDDPNLTPDGNDPEGNLDPTGGLDRPSISPS